MKVQPDPREAYVTQCRTPWVQNHPEYRRAAATLAKARSAASAVDWDEYPLTYVENVERAAADLKKAEAEFEAIRADLTKQYDDAF